MTTRSPVTPDAQRSATSRRFFRLASSLLLLTGLALLPQSNLLAQSTGTGTISGRVINSSDGKYMPFVTVRVPGTNVSATTNNIGEYTLRNVPAAMAQMPAGLPWRLVATLALLQLFLLLFFQERR